MALVIVESPNKIKKIQQILGSNYVVMASVGHIMDLEKKNMGIDLKTWTPKYIINQNKLEVVKKLKKEAENHKEIYIATDGDREGENIGYSILDILPKKNKKFYRVVFKELTKSAILKEMANPTGFNENLNLAQQTRRMTDRVVGFSVSPVMWSKGLKGTSAGRVQSAALKFIIDREREILNFKEEEYWSIIAQTDEGFDVEFYGDINGKIIPKSKFEVDNLIKSIKKDLTITDYQKKTRSREPLPPFITASLQKEAGTKFGWSAQKVMDEAQKLFASGAISYHRTDSTRTEPQKLQELRDRIESQHGKNYLSLQPINYSQNAAQDAHTCIRPTYEPISMTLTSDETKLLKLIDDRFTASQMSSANFEQVQIKFSDGNYEFRTSGSILKFDGFLKVYGSATKDVNLPLLTKNQKIKIKKIKPTQHFTKPPARYTEPAFTDLMEKQGIGRPATYAATIETLIERNYVVRENKSLKPTEIGFMVCQYLEKYFANLTSPDFTSKMEKEVDDIADGKIEIKSILDSFYQELSKDLITAKKDKTLNFFETEQECERCNPKVKMIKKVSSHGVFLGCPNYPTCGFTLNINPDGSFSKSKVETGIPCPECGNTVIEKKSKFGKFLACSGYPACTWKGSLDKEGKIAEKKVLELTDFDCPSCKGKMVKRKQKSEFLGCQNYPKCKQTMSLDQDGKPVIKIVKKKAETTNETCSKCKKNKLLIRENKKDGTKFLACSGFPSCKFTKKYEGA